MMAKACYLRGPTTHIKLLKSTVKELASLKVGNENYDSVIKRLISIAKSARVSGI